MKELGIFFGGLMLLVLGGGFLITQATSNSSGPTQPINFSHQKHVTSLSLPCTFCHEGVTTGRAATIPKMQKCLTCHQAPVTQNPEAERIKAYAAAGQEPPWVRLFRLSGDILYSHKVHVGEQGLACTTCHGDIGAMPQITRGFGGRGVGGMSGRPLMEFCLSCHRERGTPASQDCLTCHK